MNHKGAAKLSIAIISQAGEEAMELFKRLQADPYFDKAEDLQDELQRIRQFFSSEWFEILCCIAEVDSDWMREKVREALNDK